MFKSAKWKSTDKNKIKVVFKLQFLATQVPQVGWDTLMVSLIPVDVGKPTVRSEKASVHDGTCSWESPIYEAVKFTQEAKTGKFNEKIYKLIVSSGSSKSAILGEITMDFSDYAEAVKATSVSFPLKISNSGPLLHVIVYRMHGDVGQSEVEENVDFMAKFPDGSIKRTEVSENAESNGNFVVSRGYEATSTSSSESSSERNTPRELGLKPSTNNNFHEDPTSLRSSLSRNTIPHKRSNTDWSVDSLEDNVMKERYPQVSSDSTVEKFKTDVVVLARQVEVYELELQTLRKQIVKESKKGQDLSKEVVTVKEERDLLRKECQQLRASRKNIDETKVSKKLESDDQGSIALLNELRQELNHEKDLNANLRLQLQKIQESNSELILAVQDLDEMLEKKNEEISDISVKLATDEKHKAVHTKEDEDQRELEVIIKEHRNEKDTCLLEKKIVELYSEIDIYRRDRDELEMQMEQLALDYEILKQENHDLSFKLESNQLQDQLKMQYELETHVENLEREVKRQAKEFLASLGTINELESKVKSLVEQLKNQEEELTESFSTIDELEAQVNRLEKQLKNQDEELAASLVTINELETQVKSLEKELKNQEEELSASLSANNELQTQVENLGGEVKIQENEFLSSLDTINELKTQVKSLEEELEKQAQGFVADLDELTRVKVEQEKRAIQVEDSLRKTRWANANTAEKLQEEFRRLSIQMASTFDTNEKLALKAVEEANEIRLQKIHLEELLEKANEEIGLVKDEYEEKLKDLLNQIDMKKRETLTMLEHEDKSKKLEYQQEHEKEIPEAFLKEILMLKAEIERLREEKSKLEEQKQNLKVEMEIMKTSVDEVKMLVQTRNVEKDELERRIDIVRKEAEKSLEELNNMRSLKNEKETKVGILQSEVETLRDQHNDLKHSLVGNEVEKENLRKQISDLRNDLQKKEYLSLDEFKLLETQIQQKEAALQKSIYSFMAKEKNLYEKIEELEQEMEELSQNNTIQKIKDADNISSSNNNATKPIKRQNKDKEHIVSPSCNGGQANLYKLLSEMEFLKKKNKSMESELKDMQERYSELSLKFAEVEGERQQLVMTVRNLKNIKKI